MGSLVPGFDHDVFVSYATVDDSPKGNGWVTAFVELLRERLAAAYGRRHENRVWWDRSSIDEEAALTQQISDRVRKSACLVVILSRGYVASNWCREELNAFLDAMKAQPERDSRIFLIDIGNLLEADRPEEFRDIRGRHFWVQPPSTESPEDRQTLAAPVPRTHPDFEDFYSKVDSLAKDVFSKIKKIKKAVEAAGPVGLELPVVAKTKDDSEKPTEIAVAAAPGATVIAATEPIKTPVTKVASSFSPVEPYNWDRGDFPVTVLVSCKSVNDESRIRTIAESLTGPIPVFNGSNSDILSAGHNEHFRFAFQYVPHESILFEAKNFLTQSESRLLIVVSDSLLEAQPNNLAEQIRGLFRGPAEFFCGLIALTEGQTSRVRDIDRVLNLKILAESIFLRELSRTADGLRLKAPPAKLLVPAEPIVIRLVQTPDEMMRCLRLRHLIYNRMHYLSDEISQHPSEIELDCYDLFDEKSGTGAIHFLAWSESLGDVVGTARLIVPRQFEFSESKSVLGDPPENILRQQAAFIREIIHEKDSAEVLKRTVTKRTFNRLPVLQSAANLDKSLLRGIGLTEVSRVITAPRYRGCGVGRLLVRALVAASIDLQKPNVVLECIPAHVPMYEKFGFQVIEGAEGRDESLDQEAVAMILQQGGMLVKARGVAERDLKMIQREEQARSLADKGYLCLCEKKRCWEQGLYDLKDHEECPMKSEKSELIPLRTSTISQ